MKDSILNSWHRFACAYLAGALRDAHNPEGRELAEKLGVAKEARDWLASDEVRGVVLLLGFDPDKLVLVLVKLGELPSSPQPTYEQLSLEGMLYDD